MPDPGWYADPHEPGRLRWWDGASWTHHRQPDPNAPPPAAQTTPTAPAASDLTPGPSPWAPPGPSSPGDLPGAAAPSGWTPPVPGAPSGWTPPTPGAPSGWYPPGPADPSAASWGVAPWSPPVPPPPVRRNPWVLIGSIAAALVLFGVMLVVLFALVGSDSSSSSGASDVGSPDSSGMADRAAEAGIPVLGSEGSATHTHTLVRVEVDGRPVTIPSFIGIDRLGGRIAAVHTHDNKGVVHVESPHTDDHYTLGQFLTLWGAGSTDAQLCEFFATSGCQVEVSVVDPTVPDRRTMNEFGPMPNHAQTPALGLDTQLDQGAVIVVSITTAAHT